VTEPSTPGQPHSEPIEGGPAFATTSTVAATWALFAGLALVMMGNGLQGSLLGVRASAEGFGLVVTGLVMAAYFAGFFAGSRYAEHALKSVGHIRVFAALASLASSAAILHVVSVTPVTWSIMRFVFGLCMAGIYVVIESWLNDLATNETRGRILALYMIVTMGGLSGGQLLLNVGSTTGPSLFILASVLISVSLLPITLSASSSPPLSVPEPMGLRELIKVVPTGALTSFMNGMGVAVLMSLGAVYATREGLSGGRLSIFITAPIMGSWMLQWPIGWMADHLPRRGVMLGTATACGATAIVLAFVPSDGLAALPLMFVLGGTLFPLYSLSIAYTNDRLPPEKIMGGSATLVRVNAGGAVIGPLLGAGLMSTLGSSFFFLSIAGTVAVIAVFLVYLIVVADAPSTADQDAYVAFPSRGSSAALGLIRRRRSAQATHVDD
jgi:MFS family permease